ncbi:MAG: RagB/SusD family nutrient uptake outer membrane protein, partial [Bacteroidales bacterium]|nr:RagB/SusD family nutrient uptake outer membrane protein [Bacteroidales bacterium]
AAAGYYARALMFRHKFADALTVLKDIIDGKYGNYQLNADYGDNFRSTVENTAESLWEVQFLDYGVGGSDMEWTAANNSKSSTQGQALETVFGNGDILGWNDLAATPWLYQTFKSQTTKNGTVDPRLYWTLISYEDDYNTMNGFENKAFTVKYNKHVTTGTRKGISVAKHTTARENIYAQVAAAGLSCGVNLRLMRYSDVLLRAAECENEISGPTQQAIDWINKVRSRAGLENLKAEDFANADALFEQIANVERPTEFGCEHGRMQDIIRWGWLYNEGRKAQLRKHACTYWNDDAKVGVLPDSPDSADDDPFSHWAPGHEYLPITTFIMNTNSNLKGNSANRGEEAAHNLSVHNVVKGIGVQ